MTVDTLFIYDTHENYKGILSNLNSSMCPFFKDNRYSRLDNSAETLEFTTLLSHENGVPQSLNEEGYIVFKDDDGDFVQYKIIRVEEDRITRTKSVVAVGSWIELTKEFVEPFSFADLTAEQMLTQFLLNTRWRVGEVEYNGVKSLSTEKMISVLDATQRIRTNFELEPRFRIEIQNNKIVGRYCDLLKHRGKKYERRFEVKKDVLGMRRIVDSSELVTAMYGFGQQEESSEIDTPLDFSSVQWSVLDGDPVDKPLGQKWVGNPDALSRYSTDGKYTFGIHESTVQGDPYLLLQKTWEVLKRRSLPRITYEIELALLGKVGIGDTITVHDLTDAENPLIVEARVLELEGPISEDKKGKAILGNYRELQKVDITETLQDQLRKYATKVQLQREMDELNIKINTEVEQVYTSLSDLNTYIVGAFADGLIDEAEAKAIEKYLNSLSVEKADVDAKYTEIYNHVDLTNTTVKTDLYNKKVAYNTAHTNLINSINTAIADSKTTDEEKQDVDSKFANYRTALANLTTIFEKALTDISQSQATTAKEGAKDDIKGGIVPLPTGALNGNISSQTNNIIGGAGETLVEGQGVVSTFIFNSGGEKSGFDWGGQVESAGGAVINTPIAIRFFIPQNFKVTSAIIVTESLPFHLFDGVTGNYLHSMWIKWMHLFKSTQPDRTYAIGWKYGEYFINYDDSGGVDVTRDVWGQSSWNPMPSGPDDLTIKKMTGNLINHITQGWNQFYAKTTDAPGSTNQGYLRHTVVIKGYQR